MSDNLFSCKFSISYPCQSICDRGHVAAAFEARSTEPQKTPRGGSMRIPVPMMLLLMLVQACQAWTQSVAPDNRYVLKAGASYIAGYPYVPRNSKGEPKQAHGDIYLGMDSLRFQFCSENQSGSPDSFAEGLVASTDKSACGGQCGPRLCQQVRIPYDRMKLLARGRVVGMGGTSEDVQVASAGIGIAGLIAGIGTGGSAEKWLIGATVGAAAVGFGIHEYELKRANYLSIYFTPSQQVDAALPCSHSNLPPAGTPSAEPAAAGADGKDSKKPAQPPPPVNLFAEAKGCNVALFQIFNSHQYWNLSMILTGRTGREFVAQGAEQK